MLHAHIHTQSQSSYIKITVVWVMIPCSFVNACQWLKKICYLSLQDRLWRWNKLPHISSTKQCTWCHNTKIHKLNLHHWEKPDIYSASYIIGYSKIILYCPLILFPLVLRYLSIFSFLTAVTEILSSKKETTFHNYTNNNRQKTLLVINKQMMLYLLESQDLIITPNALWG